MSDDLCARCGRQTPDGDALAWIGGRTICVDCFTLAEYREARDRLRVNAVIYLASHDPDVRQVGEQIRHMLDLANRVERLHQDPPDTAERRFDPTRPREEKP